MKNHLEVVQTLVLYNFLCSHARLIRLKNIIINSSILLFLSSYNLVSFADFLREHYELIECIADENHNNATPINMAADLSSTELLDFYLG